MFRSFYPFQNYFITCLYILATRQLISLFVNDLFHFFRNSIQLNTLLQIPFHICSNAYIKNEHSTKHK